MDSGVAVLESSPVLGLLAAFLQKKGLSIFSQKCRPNGFSFLVSVWATFALKMSHSFNNSHVLSVLPQNVAQTTVKFQHSNKKLETGEMLKLSKLSLFSGSIEPMDPIVPMSKFPGCPGNIPP